MMRQTSLHPHFALESTLRFTLISRWTVRKAPWYNIDGNLPQFSEWASRDVLVQLGSRQR